MSANLFIVGVSTLLTVGHFVLARRAGQWRRGIVWAIRLTLYAGAFGGMLTAFGARAAIAVLVLAGIFTLVAVLLKINFRMVHSARHPKYERCY